MSLARLLQLASPALPVGAYSYSQGLEAAVEASTVHDAASAEAWIADVLEFSVARIEVPLLRLQIEMPTQARNDFFLATRETAELRAETLQMGQSLLHLAGELEWLGGDAREILPALAPITLPAAYALAARGCDVRSERALAAYIWSWLENQTLAAMKLVPLGQVAGQKMLVALAARIPAIVGEASKLEDDDISTFAPGLALASARHETQYTRLFRS